MKLVPHFTFDGQAEEALNFYASVFNGKIESLIRYKDFQTGEPGEVGKKDMDRIMFSSVSIGDNCKINMCDCGPEEKKSSGSGIFMDVEYSDTMELERVYHAISAGGSVLMPLGKTHWSENFAYVADKFGIRWSLMQEE